MFNEVGTEYIESFDYRNKHVIDVNFVILPQVKLFLRPNKGLDTLLSTSR